MSDQQIDKDILSMLPDPNTYEGIRYRVHSVNPLVRQLDPFAQTTFYEFDKVEYFDPSTNKRVYKWERS